MSISRLFSWNDWMLIFVILGLFSGSRAHPSTGEAQLAKRFGGIHVVPGNCSSQHIDAARTSILDASYLAGAGLNAAANFSELPFSYFFQSEPGTANKVASLYKRVIAAQQGHGPFIPVYCEDPFNHCGPNPHWAAYAWNGLPDNAISPSIVLCPRGLSFTRNPLPCTGPPGAISLGWLMLHELTHIPHIFGAPDGSISVDPGSMKAADTNAQVLNGTDMTADPNAYAFLGSWAWDMGLGGQPWNQQEICLDRFSTGMFVSVIGETAVVLQASRTCATDLYGLCF